MNYAEMSDIQINAMVSNALYGEVSRGHQMELANGVVDYCNNPADAWPIIVENKINLYFSNNEQMAQFYQYGRESVESSDANALRAAMVVFLMMMKEGEGE